MRSKAILVAVCVLGWAGSSAASDVTSFEAALDKLVTDNNLPGLSAGIVKDQKLVWSRGFGYADLEQEIPATASTPYRLASVSKPFAAVPGETVYSGPARW